MRVANYIVTAEAPPDWDGYVQAHPDARAFHTASAVRIGADAFGLRVHFVTVRRKDGTLCGVLPLIEQTLIPWTRTLVSLPFCTYGGPLADDDEALLSLLAGAEAVARERRARRIILRNPRHMPAIPHEASLEKVSMVMELPDSIEELAHRLGSKLRSQIKRAERVDPQVNWGRGELVRDFYEVFCSVMHDLGTPVYPSRFFDAVVRALGDRASVAIVRVAGRPVSGAIVVRWHEGLEVPWAGTLHSMKKDAVNMRLYWELLQHAIDRGCKTFDFGRSSRDVGTYKFKSQWGATPVQLHWHSWEPNSTSKRPRPGLDRTNTEAATTVWRKLPLPVANWLGPVISARLPW